MSTVAPPPQAPPPQAPLAAPPSGVIDNPPSALSRLAIGAKLDALVLAQLAPGKLQVSTSAGPVLLETPFSAAKGQVLGLQIQARGALLRVQITMVDGQPAPTTPSTQAAQRGAPAAGQAAPPGATPGGIATPTPAAAAPVVTLTAGSTVTARLLTPATIAAAPSAIPATTGTGAAAQPTQPASPAAGLAGRLNQVGGQVRALLGGAPSATPAAPTPATSPATGGQSIQATGAAQTVPAGSAVRVTVVSVTPPTGTAPAPQAPQPGPQPITVGQSITGVVTATTATGQAIVQTPVGALALPGSPPPAGAQVTLQIAQAPQPPAADAAVDPAQAARAHVRAAAWPSVTEAMATLERADPALAQQVATTVLPNLTTGTGLAAGILMFLGALKAGDARAALGDAALRALDKARPGAGARLDGDLKGMARAGDEAQASGDWRATVVPAVAGHEIHPIRLLTRDGGGHGDDEDADDGGIRFVIDVTFDRLGRIQLDGTVPEGGKRLDLIVRSEHRLPGPMQRDIRGIVADAASLTGLGGGLTFQADPNTFIELADDDTPPDAAGGAVGITV